MEGKKGKTRKVNNTKKKTTRKRSKKKKQVTITLPSMPRPNLSLVLVIVLIVSVSVLCFMYLNEYNSNDGLESQISDLNQEIQDTWFQYNGLVSFIRPKSTSDAVVIQEDASYLYISHSEEISFFDVSGSTFRVPKSEEGLYLIEEIEVIGQG
jgi:hypothetical protein